MELAALLLIAALIWYYGHYLLVVGNKLIELHARVVIDHLIPLQADVRYLKDSSDTRTIVRTIESAASAIRDIDEKLYGIDKTDWHRVNKIVDKLEEIDASLGTLNNISSTLDSIEGNLP
jgi:hypothetical protein